ncbi:MAG TPA: RNA polymerase sigma-70 factor [Flavipsychrobacter sp.]
MQQAVIFAPEKATHRMPDIGIIHTTRDIDLVFEQVFKEHFKNLHAYACSILKDEDEAEEMVQNVFYKLWEKKEKIGELQSVPAYLYRSVYNECMNYVKHEKVKMTYEAHAVHHGAMAGQAADTATAKELEHRIAEALAGLPEQCRTIFQLSRFEELKYREIADKMGLSVKTVENQMGKALKILRTKLADYISVIGLLLITLIK